MEKSNDTLVDVDNLGGDDSDTDSVYSDASISSEFFQSPETLQLNHWRDTRDEQLVTVSSLSDVRFVHAIGFIGGGATLQTIKCQLKSRSVIDLFLLQNVPDLHK